MKQSTINKLRIMQQIQVQLSINGFKTTMHVDQEMTLTSDYAALVVMNKDTCEVLKEIDSERVTESFLLEYWSTITESGGYA